MAEADLGGAAAGGHQRRVVRPGAVGLDPRRGRLPGPLVRLGRRGPLHRRRGGRGPFVYDVEGTRYLDLVQSYGAVLLGHAHPAVTEAVRRAAGSGTTFGMPTPGEVLLAEAICERVAGCEQVRLVSSGTEAAMSAVRLARGATGRDRVVKFAGCYHGHADGLLAGGGSGVATLGSARLGRRAGRGGGRHRGGALQRGPRARPVGGLRDRRAGGGQHEPGGPGRRGSSRGCAPPATPSGRCSSSTR